MFKLLTLPGVGIMKYPFVSIVMSTYERGSLIGESIQSVIDQTYEHWELIIMDDGSTDDTEQVVRNFADDRIKYSFLPHSGFLGKVKNAAIAKSRGELIAFQDSDDLWRADKLEVQVKLLNQYPEASFVLSNGDQFGEFATPTPDYQNLFAGSMFLPMIRDSKFCFYSTSLVFRKSVLAETGPLDESVPFMRDVEFFFRMSCKVTGIFTNERLVNIRRHTGNFSNSFHVNAYFESIRIYESLHRNGNLNMKQFNHLASICYYKIALLYLRQQQANHAVLNFWRYTRLRPFHYKGWIRIFQSGLSRLLNKTAATA